MAVGSIQAMKVFAAGFVQSFYYKQMWEDDANFTINLVRE